MNHSLTVSDRMRRVARVADRVGVLTLAREAGLPESTVRSYRDRGWVLKSLPNVEALIAAAERLDARPLGRTSGRARAGR
jgi:hypothetical protein